VSRRHHYRRRSGDPADLDMTTFLNLMVVLVPFLLITAVFSRITIVELSLPSSAGGAAISEPKFRVEVIVREQGLEITNGTVPIAALPNKEGEYDLERLGELVMSLKRQHPGTEDASVLLEPQIEYDHLIKVMDVVRSAPLPADWKPASEGEDAHAGAEAGDEAGDGSQQVARRIALFPNISIGDAP
jgi:biopolymer transport protein ExbD